MNLKQAVLTLESMSKNLHKTMSTLQRQLHQMDQTIEEIKFQHQRFLGTIQVPPPMEAVHPVEQLPRTLIPGMVGLGQQPSIEGMRQFMQAGGAPWQGY